MEERELDCRGLSCPEPVLRIRAHLQEVESGRTLVRASSATARDNILRLARTLGWRAEATERDGEYELRLER